MKKELNTDGRTTSVVNGFSQRGHQVCNLKIRKYWMIPCRRVWQSRAQSQARVFTSTQVKGTRGYFKLVKHCTWLLITENPEKVNNPQTRVNKNFREGLANPTRTAPAFPLGTVPEILYWKFKFKVFQEQRLKIHQFISSGINWKVRKRQSGKFKVNTTWDLLAFGDPSVYCRNWAPVWQTDRN